MNARPTPIEAVTALYESCENADERVALDHAWAELRGFTLPGRYDDNDLGAAEKAVEGTRAPTWP